MTSASTKFISSDAADCSGKFEEHIARLWSSYPNAHVFALLDCVFSDRCYAVLLRSGLSSRSLYDLSDKPNPELVAVSPTLVPITQGNISVWHTLLRHTDGLPMLSVIVTPEEIDALALRLRQWCVVDADGQQLVLRFADTRRLPDMVTVLTPQQHGEFFGPAHAWLYRNRSAEWEALALPNASFPVAENVTLDEKQCVRLIECSEADEIMHAIRNDNPAICNQYDLGTIYKLISQGLQRAAHYHIAETDRLHWCGLYLQQPTFETIPEVVSLLASLNRQEKEYGEIRDGLSGMV